MTNPIKEDEAELDGDDAAIKALEQVREMSFDILSLCIANNINSARLPVALAFAAGTAIKIMSDDKKLDLAAGIKNAFYALEDAAFFDVDIIHDNDPVKGRPN